MISSLLACFILYIFYSYSRFNKNDITIRFIITPLLIICLYTLLITSGSATAIFLELICVAILTFLYHACSGILFNNIDLFKKIFHFNHLMYDFKQLKTMLNQSKKDSQTIYEDIKKTKNDMVDFVHETNQFQNEQELKEKSKNNKNKNKEQSDKQTTTNTEQETSLNSKTLNHIINKSTLKTESKKLKNDEQVIKSDAFKLQSDARILKKEIHQITHDLDILSNLKLHITLGEFILFTFSVIATGLREVIIFILMSAVLYNILHILFTDIEHHYLEHQKYPIIKSGFYFLLSIGIALLVFIIIKNLNWLYSYQNIFISAINSHSILQ